jgi:hypothetical protein
MKPILLFALVLCATHARSQKTADSTTIECTLLITVPQHDKQIYKPIFRLTAKDIAHLPVVSIMELLNGRFPFVFADPPSASMYTFLVDGHLVINPNAINISQIALIEFYPVSLDAGSGSLACQGTFVITTKQAKEGGAEFIVRSQTGLLIPDKSAGSGSITDSDSELFTSQEVGYVFNKNKLHLNAGGSFTKSGLPNQTVTADVYRQDNSSDFFRQKLSLFGAYDASAKLHFSLALLGTLQQRDMASNTEYFFPAGNTEFHSKNDQAYAAAAVGIQYLSHRVKNTFQLEYSRLKSETDGQVIQFGQPPNNTDLHVNDDLSNKYSRIAVVNTSKGTFNTFRQTSFGWQVILRYHELKVNNNFTSITGPPSGPPINFTTANAKRTESSLAAMPSFSIDVKRRLFAGVGVIFDTWKNSVYRDTKKELVLPYAGIKWAVPVKHAGISSLELHSTFGKSQPFVFRADPLDMYSMPGTAPLFGPVITMDDPDAGYSWVTGINGGFLKNRLLISLNYLRGNGFPAIFTPMPMGGATLEYREVERNGASIDLQATIAEKKAFSCKFRTMLFYERVKLKEQSSNPDVYTDHPFLNDDLSPQLRGTATIDATAGNFFMQLQGLLRFREAGKYVYGNGNRVPDSDHGLTFLVVGYSVALKKSDDRKRLDISVQTKNLLAMKGYRAAHYYGSKYIGVGANLQL